MAAKGGRQPFKPNAELSKIANRLWDLDTNRLTPGVDYAIDLQGYTKVYKQGREDRARDPLFVMVDENKFQQLPTFKTFIALLDNYAKETGVAEEVTPEEEQENRAFLNEIMKTDVMKECHKYLAERKLVPGDVNGFKQALYDLWFKLYRRTRGVRAADSSGFEHVFVGECKRGTDDVIGFHNWIQFYLEEKRGNVDYKGWIPPRGKSGKKKDNNAQLISIQFSWKQDVKPVGSSFIGTSPEFEVALYTVMYYVGDQKNCIEIEDYDVEITVHKMGDKLGSSFPVSIQ